MGAKKIWNLPADLARLIMREQKAFIWKHFKKFSVLKGELDCVYTKKGAETIWGEGSGYKGYTDWLLRKVQRSTVQSLGGGEVWVKNKEV